jgi:hypothetical protein
VDEECDTPKSGFGPVLEIRPVTYGDAVTCATVAPSVEGTPAVVKDTAPASVKTDTVEVAGVGTTTGRCWFPVCLITVVITFVLSKDCCKNVGFYNC